MRARWKSSTSSHRPSAGAPVLLSLVLCASALGCAGCVSRERINQDPLIVAEQLRAAGFSGRAVIVWGTGHLGGQAFNLTGSSGFVEVTVEPGAADAQGGETSPQPRQIEPPAEKGGGSPGAAAPGGEGSQRPLAGTEGLA